METKTQHTPTPWTFMKDGIFQAGNGSQGWICYFWGEKLSPTDQANAALIVKAVNSHADLLAALNNLVNLYVANKGKDDEFITCITPPHANEMTKTRRKNSETWSAFDAARAAIAKAEDKS